MRSELRDTRMNRRHLADWWSGFGNGLIVGLAIAGAIAWLWR